VAEPYCPVCRDHEAVGFALLAGRRYWRCAACEATFLDPGQRPDRAAELAHYRTHRNDPADPGYRHFLTRLAGPLLGRLPPASSILDYGCGAGPALAAMLHEAGHRVSLWDPFFHPDPAALEGRYDAVTLTEVAEHFHVPWREFDRLGMLVRPGGLVALMTCLQTDDARFADWHYRRDPTHVVFYREATLRHIAATRGWQLELPVKDVALFRVPA
jgi:hypothetical protein